MLTTHIINVKDVQTQIRIQITKYQRLTRTNDFRFIILNKPHVYQHHSGHTMKIGHKRKRVHDIAAPFR